MVKFSDKNYSDEVTYEDSYNHHPYTNFCSPEYMVKSLGWKKCKEIYLSGKDKDLSSKVNFYTSGYMYEFFFVDLQHLLSFYYEDIPKYY